MKTSSKLKASVGAFASVAGGILTAMPTMAVTASQSHSDIGFSGYLTNEKAGEAKNQDLMDTLNVILNVALGLIGFIAVVMIIVGGLQYTTSSGDTSKVAKAKNTIMYGVIGLVVALLAFAIVNFVLGNVF